VQGIEKAKTQANSLFSQGSLEESVRWFSKALWTVDSKRAADVSGDLHSVLHSNRAFAYLKLGHWAKADVDCTAALALNDRNTKAKYRRAAARFELGQLEPALRDVDQVLQELPDPNSNREAVMLKQKIEDRLRREAPKEAPQEAKADVWRQLEIVEASEDEEEEAARAGTADEEAEAFPDVQIERSVDGIIRAKDRGNVLFSEGSIEDSVRWFSKAIWLVEGERVAGVPSDLHSILHSNRSFAHLRLRRWAEAEADCSRALELNARNRKAAYRRALARLELGRPQAALEDAELVLQSGGEPHAAQDAEELRRQILRTMEAAREATGTAPAQPGQPPPPPAAVAATAKAPAAPQRPAQAAPVQEAEVLPEVCVERTRKGVEAAKDRGNALFAEGSTEKAAQHFSKCLWLVESGYVADAVDDESWSSATRTILYSNRAFAHYRLRRWEEAESDCTQSLQLKPNGVKALYRRALARAELGKVKSALQDVEVALEQQPGNTDLQALMDRLHAQSKALATSVEVPTIDPAGPPAVSQAQAVAAAPTPQAALQAEALPRPQRAAGRGAVAPRAAAVPTVPASSPKGALELLRNFHSLKRHPAVLARYVRERVPPQLLQSLFSRSPMEADDLATLLLALRNSVQDPGADFGPDAAAEYLRQVLRTRNAETQFAMLSSSEKQVLRELVGALPAGGEARKTLEGPLAALLA